jgi:hypothetical protein
LETQVNRRTLVAKGSASAFALTLAGLAANRAVNAQDATPEPGTTDNGNGTTGTQETPENSAATQYQEFIAALATNLGVADATTVDTAIRTTLKGFVDAELAAGDLAANDATEMKEAIDAAEAPIWIGGFGRGGGLGRHGGMKSDGRGIGRPGRDTQKPDDSGTDDTTPGVEASPTTTA